MERIRPATPQDALTLSLIHAETWKTAYRGHLPDDFLDHLSHQRWLPIFTESLQQGSIEAALFCVEDIPTGCITYGPAREQEMAGYAEIPSIYVLPAYWGCQQGYRLMTYALQQLKKQGYPNCYLWVLKENLQARRFYERIGFNYHGEEKLFLHEGMQLTELRYTIAL